MEQIRSAWWHALVACPNCGSSKFLRPEHSDIKGKCAECGKYFEFHDNILRWHETCKTERMPLHKILERRLSSLLNPISTPLLPFRYISQIRLDRYYRRTLADLDLARKWAGHYLSGLNLLEGAIILDFGCGRGRNIGMLDQLGYRVVGQDVNINPWWHHLSNAGFQVAKECSKLPLRDAIFDLVIEVQTLHYIPEEQLLQHMQEIKRVLKPGGYWLLLEANSASFGSRVFRAQIGRLHELGKIRELTAGSGFIEIGQSFEGFYAPHFPMVINFIRKACSFRSFDLSDYDSWLSKRIKPERRGLWLLRLKR